MFALLLVLNNYRIQDGWNIRDVVPLIHGSAAASCYPVIGAGTELGEDIVGRGIAIVASETELDQRNLRAIGRGQQAVLVGSVTAAMTAVGAVTNTGHW